MNFGLDFDSLFEQEYEEERRLRSMQQSDESG